MKATLAILIFYLNVICTQAQPKVYDWLLMYYMPYDNNLSPLAYDIINQFKVNGLHGNVCVTLQTDFAGPGGMMRYVVRERIDSTRIPEEYSGASASFDDYFSWISKNFKARHYAIILLNHGGLIDEYGLDEFPLTKWLSEDSIAASVRNFNRKTGIGKLDLFFQQVCARGTIENAYEFKDIASFTMVSQSLVPAPNYYYGEVFRSLDRGEAKSGAQLADLIVRKDKDDMYYSYTLVNNSKWNRWLKLFDAYTNSLKPAELELQPDSIKTVGYWHENYWDFIGTLNSIRRREKVPEEAIRLVEFTSQQLVQKLYLSPVDRRMVGYCGLSILAPFRKGRTVNMSLFGQPAYDGWLAVIWEIRKNRKGKDLP